jgi:hypothetical protein
MAAPSTAARIAGPFPADATPLADREKPIASFRPARAVAMPAPAGTIISQRTSSFPNSRARQSSLSARNSACKPCTNVRCHPKSSRGERPDDADPAPPAIVGLVPEQAPHTAAPTHRRQPFPADCPRPHFREGRATRQVSWHRQPFLSNRGQRARSQPIKTRLATHRPTQFQARASCPEGFDGNEKGPPLGGGGPDSAVADLLASGFPLAARRWLRSTGRQNPQLFFA